MNKRLLFIFFIFILQCSVYATGTHPKLLLHFDMNGTIIAIDTAGNKTNKEAVISALADTYKDKWDEKLDHPISYSDYVNEHLLQGKSKQERHNKIYDFLSFVNDTKYPLATQIQAQYDQAFSKLQHQKTLVLSSFYALLNYLQMNEYDFSIIIRTFGSEGKIVAEEINSYTHKNFFTKQLYFKDAIPYVLNKPEADTPIKDFYTFLKKNKNVLIQDDWSRWFSHGEKSEFGKIFPIDLKDTTTCSLFFDDNIKEELSSGKNIVSPVDCATNTPLAIQPLIQSHNIIPVSTLQAIVDDQYYIQLLERKEQYDSQKH